MEDFVATGNHRPQELAAISHKGFTLIELVIVLAVLGALASIAVPQLTGLQEEAKLNGAATIIASGVRDQFVRDIISGDVSDGNGSTLWNGSCAGPGYNRGALTGNHADFDGLENIEDYELYDPENSDAPNGKYVEIELPEYNPGTNQTKSFTCHLGFASS